MVQRYKLEALLFTKGFSSVALRTLFLFEDRLPAGSPPVYLPRGDRAIYVRSGSADFVFDTSSQFLWENSGMTSADELTIAAGELDTVLWRWELATDCESTEESYLLRSAPGVSTELKLAMTCDLDDRFTWLMRLDTVTFPPGGIALTHLHQGPGIRIVRKGEITPSKPRALSRYTELAGPGRRRVSCRYMHPPPKMVPPRLSGASCCPSRTRVSARSESCIQMTEAGQTPSLTGSCPNGS
jgi:hypothetical protein